MKCRKLKTMLLLFLVSCLVYPCYSIAFKPIEWSRLDTNLNSLELNLEKLENDNNTLQIQLQAALNQLSEQAQYSANQQLQLRTYEDKLKKYELHIKIWKSCCVVSVIVMPVLTTLVYKRIGE